MGTPACRATLPICALALLVAASGLVRADSDAPIARTGSADPLPELTKPVEPEPRHSGAGAEVGLDRLLKLPSSMKFEGERRAGATADEWRSRFEQSRLEVETAHQELERAKSELDAIADGSGGGQWQVAPPGSNQTQVSPLSFKLREEIRRGRERLSEAERELRDLRIEADLARVPESWRTPSAQ